MLTKFKLKIQPPNEEDGHEIEFFDITEAQARTEFAIYARNNNMPAGTKISLSEWNYNEKNGGWYISNIFIIAYKGITDDLETIQKG